MAPNFDLLSCIDSEGDFEVPIQVPRGLRSFVRQVSRRLIGDQSVAESRIELLKRLVEMAHKRIELSIAEYIEHVWFADVEDERKVSVYIWEEKDAEAAKSKWPTARNWRHATREEILYTKSEADLLQEQCCELEGGPTDYQVQKAYALHLVGMAIRHAIDTGWDSTASSFLVIAGIVAADASFNLAFELSEANEKDAAAFRGKNGAAKRWGKLEPVKTFVLGEWIKLKKDRPSLSARQFAASIAEKAIAMSAEAECKLSESNAQRTICDWIRESKTANAAQA